MKYTEDALVIGQRLAEEERQAREKRIKNALPHGNWHQTYPFNRVDRQYIADALYRIRYEGRRHDEEPSAQEILDDLCSNIFGCEFDEVLEAWDRFLG